MALPAQITTNLFSDFKNSLIGPFPRVSQVAQNTDNGSPRAIGDVAGNQKQAQSFQVTADGELTSVDVYVGGKTGSPTDFIMIKIYSDSSGTPGTLLATGTSIPMANLTTAYKFARSVFFLPIAVVVSTTYWIVAERSGAANASNYCLWQSNSTNPYASGKMSVFNGSASTWSDYSSGTTDARFKANIRVAGRYQPCVDKTNNKVRMFKSVDGGNTWSEQDSANALSLSSTSNFKSISAQAADTQIRINAIISATALNVLRFDTATDLWTTSVLGDASTTLNTNVSGAAPALYGFRPNVAIQNIQVYNGANETVMGAPRRRVKMSRGPTFQTTEFDVAGSANTPDVTLPGTAVDHDLRAFVMDGNEVAHIFWTQSDDSSIRHRQFNTDNTFSTTNTIGASPAVTSNTSAYPVGIPTGYYRNDDWYIAIPYVDSGVLKVARCLASGAATASNWTITSVITATIETTNSNPAVLIADNEQGGKLFLIYTKSDGKLYYTHDQATDSWVSEQELHPGTKTVGAISGGVLLDAIGITYLDTAPTPDDLKFDSL